MEGVGFTSSLMPARCARSTTLSKPTSSATLMVAHVDGFRQRIPVRDRRRRNLFRSSSANTAPDRPHSTWSARPPRWRTGVSTVAPGVIAGIHRRGINERLEDRTGLPFGIDVIQLADAVIAPADQRLDFAGMRIERDQRALRLHERHAAEPPLPARHARPLPSCRRRPLRWRTSADRDRAWCRCAPIPAGNRCRGSASPDRR